MPDDQERRRKIEHELASPITVLNGYLELVRAGNVTPAQAMPHMLRASTRLLAVLAELTEETDPLPA